MLTLADLIRMDGTGTLRRTEKRAASHGEIRVTLVKPVHVYISGQFEQLVTYGPFKAFMLSEKDLSVWEEVRELATNN